jgi:cell division protease FtsH
MNNGRRRPDFRRGRQDPADPNKKPMPKWVVWLAIGLLALALVGPQIWPAEDATKITYTEFLSQVRSDKVREITINNTSNKISGEFKDGTKFSTTGNVDGLSDADEELLKQKGVDYNYSTPQPNWFTSLIPLLLPCSCNGAQWAKPGASCQLVVHARRPIKPTNHRPHSLMSLDTKA